MCNLIPCPKVADPHHFNEDPYPSYHLNAYPARWPLYCISGTKKDIPHVKVIDDSVITTLGLISCLFVV